MVLVELAARWGATDNRLAMADIVAEVGRTVVEGASTADTLAATALPLVAVVEQLQLRPHAGA